MLDKKGILILRDQKAGTPAAANNLLRMLRIIMRFAVERGWRRDDPTQGVKFLRYRSEGFHTWSEAEISKFEARWPIGSRERLAFDLLLCTAQRSGDVRRMGPQHIRERTITVRQQKTGATLELPVIDALAASLAARPSGHLTFLVTQHGQPYTAKGFGNWFSAACRSAGLPPGCSAHGLRKAAATRLADAGCNVHQIMAVTGHKTMSEVARYTAKASQRRGAEAAFAQVGRTKSEHELSNRLNRLDKVGGK
ncbi:MAG: tyrosine-type recombinase/integrase [Caulobacter sp.]|nr:tyrosine-type recombinase/integrase [Caulobacter sp.]